MIDVNNSGFIRCLHLYFASFLLQFQPFAALFVFSCTETLTDVLTAVLDLVLRCAWSCRVQKKNNAGMCSAFTPVCPYDLIYNSNACVTKPMWRRLIGAFHMGTLVVTAGKKVASDGSFCELWYLLRICCFLFRMSVFHASFSLIIPKNPAL